MERDPDDGAPLSDPPPPSDPPPAELEPEPEWVDSFTKGADPTGEETREG
jgi:hypothetical protein